MEGLRWIAENWIVVLNAIGVVGGCDQVPVIGSDVGQQVQASRAIHTPALPHVPNAANMV